MKKELPAEKHDGMSQDCELKLEKPHNTKELYYMLKGIILHALLDIFKSQLCDWRGTF